MAEKYFEKSQEKRPVLGFLGQKEKSRYQAGRSWFLFLFCFVF